MSDTLHLFEVEYITEQGGNSRVTSTEVVAHDEAEADDIVALEDYYYLKPLSSTCLREATEQERSEYYGT